jgi:hypothetical protein
VSVLDLPGSWKARELVVQAILQEEVAFYHPVPLLSTAMVAAPPASWDVSVSQ